MGVDRSSDTGQTVCAHQSGLLVGLGGGLAALVHVADSLVLADVQLQVARGGVEVCTGLGADHQQGHLGLIGSVHQSDIAQHLAQGLGGGLTGLGALAKGLSVDLGAVLQGQGAVVLQQDNGLAVHAGSFLPVGLGGNDLGGLPGVGVGVLEHALTEQLGQGAADSAVQAGIGQHQIFLLEAGGHRVSVVVVVGAAGVALLAQLVVQQAGDQVHAALGDCIADALGLVQHVNAPAHVVDDAGVGVDVAFEAHLAAQQAVDEHLVVGKAVGLELDGVAVEVLLRSALLSAGLGVVGHDGLGIVADGCTECRDVVLLQGAGGGVDIPLACRIVGVKAVLTGTAAGEVLHGHGNTLGGNAVAAALDAGDQVVEDLLNELRVLAKGAEGALPTGVGDAVGHVHVALLQAAGVPLAADGISKLVDDVDACGALDGSSNAQGAGIGGKHAGGIVHAEHDLTVLVAAVGHDLHGNKVITGLGQVLQLVQVICQILGRGALAQDDVAVEALLDHVRGAGQGLGAEDAVGDVHGCLVQQAAFVRHGLVAVGCQTGGRILGAHAPVGGEDLADLLAGGQNLDIGLGALSRGQAPVVDCADGAGAVDVLEIQAVLLDDLALHGADGGAVGVLVALYTLGCFHCHSVFSFSFERSGPCHRAADAIPIIIGPRAEQLENFLDISALSLYSFFARGWNTSLFCGMCCTSILQSCAK